MTDIAKLRLLILLFNNVPAAVGISGKSACIPSENIWKVTTAVILQEYREMQYLVALDPGAFNQRDCLVKYCIVFISLGLI